MADTHRESDLVLDPTQYAFILDTTKGLVNCYAGPHKASLSDTERPVIYQDRRFVRCRTVQEAVKQFAVAVEGDYVVLENPAEDGKHPEHGNNAAAKLLVGRQVVIPGPTTFPLWPGQTASVIEGHQLRSNQYLVVRILNEADAQSNWGKMVAKPSDDPPKDGEDEQVAQPVKLAGMTMGKEIVICGTEVSFFIPPTGMVVEADETNSLVREAVTLERLEYCILVDENGNKRYERGPQVVFPRPTERFVKSDSGSRRFRAVELNEISGLYIKVIAPYSEDDPATEETNEYNEGDELFVTGRTQRIYFPRPEHAVIKYGEQDRHFAVAIPEGEARYVLDRLTGAVRLERGPQMFLADPRTEVIVRRVLDDRTVALWFPGNRAALDYNKHLSRLKPAVADLVEDTEVQTSGMAALASEVEAATFSRGARYMASVDPVQDFQAGDEIERKQQFTPPRTLILDTKFDGAVYIDVWTGYAIQVISRTGEREVVMGPTTRILKYDETLEKMELSTSKPKTTDRLLPTVYLRVINNKIGDIISAETADFVKVRIKVSYRVDFEGNKDKWFSVENYVKFLCDHCRSLVRNRVKQLTAQEFMHDSVSVVRDTILGARATVETDEPKAPGRTGLFFPENGMRVKDVEVLDVPIDDRKIGELIVSAQHDIMRRNIELTQAEQKLVTTKRNEEINREIAEASSKTRAVTLRLEAERQDQRDQIALAQAEAEAEKNRRDVVARGVIRDEQKEEHEINLAQRTADSEQSLNFRQREIEQDVQAAQERGRVLVDKIKAISPDLIAAMQTHGDKLVTTAIIEKLTPLATLTGENVSETFKKLMTGTAIGEVLSKAIGAGSGFGAKVDEKA